MTTQVGADLPATLGCASLMDAAKFLLPVKEFDRVRQAVRKAVERDTSTNRDIAEYVAMEIYNNLSINRLNSNKETEQS